MRSIRFLALVMAAGCGDNGNSPPDGPQHPDAPPIDNAVDTGVDTPIDMPQQGAAARIWVVGDFLTDGKRQAGAFASDATLPFNTATPPTIVVPASGQIFAGAGATAGVFDARGGKIAYVADETVATRFDLNVADADGTNPIVVVQGGAVNVEITSISLSPDGTKVAFTMDSTLINGGFDLFFAPTTAANATPVKLSPDRPVVAVTPANQDVFPTIEWSHDSKFVAFSGDLTDDAFDQAYVTDTTAATPTAVEILTRADIATQTTGAQGVRGRILFDNTDANVYFRARVSTANASQFTFFKSDLTGSKTTLTTPARGDVSVSDIGAFGITPDGNTLVFSADAPTLGTYNMFAAPIATPTTTTNLTNLTVIAGASIHSDFNTPLFFSPDSSKVAVIANFLSGADNAEEPFAIALDGTSSKRLQAITAASNQDAELIVWATNSTLFVQGDLAVNNDTATFKFDASMQDQTPTLAVGVPTGGDMLSLLVVPPPAQ